MRAPLLGIKVLDFTQFLSGPICTRAMAEMGAEVAKIEPAPSGDHARALPVVREGRSAYFVQQNLGKKSVAVNLREPRGLDLVKRMIARADVLVENFSPGVMARLGLDWPVVCGINPELIMCSISAFGQEGPLARLPGFDFIGQAYSGVLSMIGEPGEPPPFATIGVGDVGSGVCALAAINAALFARTRGAGGTYIDVSILDFYFHSLGLSVEIVGMSGGAVQPSRSGRHHITLAPLGIFKGRQGHVLIGPVSEDMWQRLAQAMGRGDLIMDERYRSNDGRRARRDELTRLIEEWLQALPDDGAALDILQRARVPCAPILSVAQAMAHPHLIGRGTIGAATDPVLGEVKMPGPLVRFAGQPDAVLTPAPFLGEHNAEILGTWLEMPERETLSLERAGILVREPVGRAA